MANSRRKYGLLIILAAAAAIAVLGWWVLGLRQTTSGKIIEKTYCSDVCPEYERTYKVYEGIDNPADCAKAGGKDVIDPAWGGYIGCAPK